MIPNRSLFRRISAILYTQAGALSVSACVTGLLAYFLLHSNFAVWWPTARLHDPVTAGAFALLAGGLCLSVLRTVDHRRNIALNRSFEVRARAHAAELQDSEQRLRYLLDNFSSGIYVHTEFRPIFANQTLLDMFGFDGLEDFLSIDSTELLLAPEERERIWGYHQARLRGDKAPNDYEFWALKKNGRKFCVNNRSFTVNWGGEIAVCTVLFDLTERRETEESFADQQRLMNSLLGTIHEGFWFLDLEGRTIDVNPAMCKILGRPRTEIVRAEIIDFVDEENATLLRKQMAKQRDGTAGVQEIALQRPDGSNVPCLYSPTPLATSAGVPTGSVGIWTDITEIKATQHILEREKERAQAASIAKTEFLAVASHELRTPLNGVLGMAHLLLGSELSDEQQQRITVIKESGESLLELLNDILDISKLESGAVEIEKSPFDIRKMLDDVSMALRLSAEQKGLVYEVRLNTEVPRTVVGDLARIRQILMNIVGNAVKFTEHGTIDISVSHEAVDQHSMVVRFEVADTGVGIDEQNHEKIFQKFAQADASTTRQFGGTGLGLAICKDLAASMGGQIGFDSALGRGSLFWFTVVCGIGEQEDLADSRLTLDATDFRLPEGSKVFHALVAEDNQINQQIAADTLKKAGFRVHLVENGLEAVEAVQDFDFDVVLMDVSMPVMDGLTATQKIREIAGDIAGIPIIALTANAMVGDREKFLDAGMDDYVSKPFDPQKLFSTINRCIGKESQSADPAPASVPYTECISQFDAGLDPAIVAPLRDDRPALWNRLIGIYLQDAPNSLETLARALADDDCATLQMTAHAMKSSSANMGAARLSDLCRQLEAAAREANLTTSRALLSELRGEYDIVAAALVREGESGNGTSNQSGMAPARLSV